jgi:hypothetical protein
MSRDYRLELRILDYLRTHQQAGDTLEGIAEWWLASQRIDESVVRVKRSLDNLTSKGVVRERQLPDGESVYVLNESGLSERNREPGIVIAFPALS